MIKFGSWGRALLLPAVQPSPSILVEVVSITIELEILFWPPGQLQTVLDD